MVSILDVLVTPTDEAVLDRCDIDWNKIDPVMFDIADLILEDNSGFELQNQIDDAENFKMAGQPYYQRVNFILGCCRLLWNEDMIRKAVKEFFTVQNSPVGVKSDGNGNYEQDALEMFIARMTKAVMTNDRIFKVCATIFEYYMGKKLWNEPTHDKTLRITRMKILRGHKQDLDFNHKKASLNVPELDTVTTTVHDENGNEIEVQGLLTGATDNDKIDKTTERWMNCEEDEKELGEAMKDWLHTKFY
jgi:hypothetical protein